MKRVFTVREAREEDREQSVKLLVKTFGDMGILEDSWTESWEKYMNRPENHDWNFVATINNKVIANFAFLENTNNIIRGRPVPFAGVWAVATAEGYRRKGILAAIYEKAFSDMRDKGLILSILEPSPYPGAQPAYEKFGYALAETYVIYEFPPDALRAVRGKSTISHRELTNAADHKIIDELSKGMAQFGSRVFVFPWMHIGSIDRGNFFLFEEGNKPVGCASLVYDEGEDGKVLNINSNYLSSLSILPSIVELVKKTSSDCSLVRWVTDPQFPIPEFIQNIQKLSTKLSGKMMMRIVDFENYCGIIDVPKGCKDEVVLKLVDEQCPWNEGVFKINAEEGKLNVMRIEDATAPDIYLDPFTLSSVMCGRTPVVALRKIGKINCSENIAKRLDTLFPTENFISYFRF